MNNFLPPVWITWKRRPSQASMFAAVFSAAVLITACDRKPPDAGLHTVTIDNVEPRRDVTGQIVDAHDGCLQFFNGRYYLYGTAYGNSDGFTNNHFRVYSSPDLGKWTLEGELLKEFPPGIYCRPYVVFNPNTHKYVLWYNWYPITLDGADRQWNGQVAVATSDTPVGPFAIINPDVRVFGAAFRPGDGSLFVDDDGTGYYIFTAIHDGYAVCVARLTPDYLGFTGRASPILAKGGEAPVLFRRDNLYYALSGPLCAFCPAGSEVHVFTSTAPLGPFIERSQINSRSENGALTVPAQETWVAKIPTPGGPAFIWMADRWGSCPDGIKGHDFQFWSGPLKFDTNGDILPIRNIAHWYIQRVDSD